jgi:hypothetical protein
MYTALRARALESQEVALAPREGDDAVCAFYNGLLPGPLRKALRGALPDESRTHSYHAC